MLMKKLRYQEFKYNTYFIAGLENIQFSPKAPFWTVVGRKKKY